MEQSDPQPVHHFDADRPRCHVQPPSGWMNDPNGPIYYKGRYHMFYQYLPNACEWDFGIIWGHAVSPDLVHWEYLPPALVPTPGWVDADGCFSGSCTIDSNGKPIILYTGVRLRSNPDCGPLPPQEQDLGMVWIESQIAAVPEDSDDELLINWKKMEVPFLPLPPADLQLTGWRDPFVLHPSSHQHENGFPQHYHILIGSGIKGQGGTALLYRSDSLLHGWELEGTLCVADDTDTGVVWECPLLVPLNPIPATLKAPTPHTAPLWLSQYQHTTTTTSSTSHQLNSLMSSSGLMVDGVGVVGKRDGSGENAATAAATSLWQLHQQHQQQHQHQHQFAAPTADEYDNLMGQLRAAVHGMHAHGVGTSSVAATLAASGSGDGGSSAQRHIILDTTAAAADGNNNSIEQQQQQQQVNEAVANDDFEFVSSQRTSPTGSGANNGDRSDDSRVLSPELWPPETITTTTPPSSSLSKPPLHPSTTDPTTTTSTTANGSGQQQQPRMERAYTFEHWNDEDKLPTEGPSATTTTRQEQRVAGVYTTTRHTDSGGGFNRIGDSTDDGEEEDLDDAKTGYEPTIGSHVYGRATTTASDSSGGEGSITSGDTTTATNSDSGGRVQSLNNCLEAYRTDGVDKEQVEEQWQNDDNNEVDVDSTVGVVVRDADADQEELDDMLNDEETVDKFAEALSGLPTIKLKKKVASPRRSSTLTKQTSGGVASHTVSAHPSAASLTSPASLQAYGTGAAGGGFLGSSSRFDSSASLGDVVSLHGAPLPAASRPWFFFTISPDAPTNPVLYWTGHVAEDGVRFELATAKGPFRLDLGDIFYAPNVCQDDQGRWLLWGWLQERRKVGSYPYAGCLGLPRVLHCTDDGRLVQAPVPEVAALREGKKFEAAHVTVYPESATPIDGVGGQRLDIECTIERGSALATGLLFRSHDAEAEGGTAIVYDWDKNQLEAIFNVPTSWHPAAAVAARQAQQQQGDLFDEEEFDPISMLMTPKVGLSRNASFAALSPFLDASNGPFSPTQLPLYNKDNNTEATTPDASPSSGTESHQLFSPGAHSDITDGGGFGGLGGLFGGGGGGGGIGINVQGASSHLPHSSSSLALSASVRNTTFLGPGSNTSGIPTTGTTTGGGGLLGTSASTTALAGGPGASSFLQPSGGSGLFHVGSMHRVGSFRLGGSPRSAVGGPNDVAVDDLDTLLDDLAAPMREEPAPLPEPRRVGGPLLMPAGANRLHLRIIVDHSCVEVFTGTGEVLSTRIYRGDPPADVHDAGIYFLAFGGAAILERVAAYELGSAWESKKDGVGEMELKKSSASLKPPSSESTTIVTMLSATSPVKAMLGGGTTSSGRDSFDGTITGGVLSRLSSMSSLPHGGSRRGSMEEDRRSGGGGGGGGIKSGGNSLQATPTTVSTKVHPADALFDEIILGFEGTSLNN